MSFNPIEKIVAKSLERFPNIRKRLSVIYKKLIYQLYRRDNKLILAQNVSILYLNELFNLDEFEEIFFGYYDKSPWNESMSHFLIHALDRDENCNLLILNFLDYSIEFIDQTDCWNEQQGSMLQWVSENEIIYNKSIDNKLKSILYHKETRETTVFNYPVQVISTEQRKALSLNYRRLSFTRPDYGYETDVTNFSPTQKLNNDGIWMVDLDKNTSELVIDLESLKKEIKGHSSIRNLRVNHCDYSPDSEYFLFLFRWSSDLGDFSRLYLAWDNGISYKIILDHKMISHYSWVSDYELIVWARTPEFGDEYLILNITNGAYKRLSKDLSKNGDGHPSQQPSGNGIITDTYPDKGRMRHLLLFDRPKNETLKIGSFFSPWNFENEKRCDLHPRWSPDGMKVSIDSTHRGFRESCIIDMNGL